jgi:hypothetical protein
MTGQQLGPLLDELAEDVRTPDLARRAWEAGRRRRRRVRTAASAGSALAVTLAVGGTALVATPDRDRDAVSAPTGPAAVSTSSAAGASEPAPKRVDGTISIAPARADEARLPWTTSTALPRRITLGGTHPVLTADPPERVLALFQHWGDQPGQLLALGSDGRLRAVEVELVQPQDSQGNVGLPLGDTSLRQDGTTAAFRSPTGSRWST